MTLILWVLESKRVFWIYEQPQTSMLMLHPAMQEFVSRVSVYKAHVFMGAFGAESPKPSFLWSSNAAVSKFSLPLPKNRAWTKVVRTRVRPDGSVCVSGNKFLKATQTYPKEFGEATVGIWKRAQKHPETERRRLSDPRLQAPAPWPHDANLGPVLEFLQVPPLRV